MENTFTKDLILFDEEERLEALRRYQLVGTPAEKSFQAMAQLISEIFAAPMAMISLVEEDYVYYRSSVGLSSSVTPRGESFCSLTVLSNEVNVIEDTLLEPIVANNPSVIGSFGLRFYAGAPLITHDGFRIGTVCLADSKPRVFDAHDRSILAGMANVVMEQIGLRLKTLLDGDYLNKINQQLKVSNEQLRASKQHFQTILDTMAEGVTIVDLEGKLSYANVMAQQTLGLVASESQDAVYHNPRWPQFKVDGSPLPDEEHPITSMMKTGMPVLDFEIAIQPPAAERFYLSVNAAPIFDHQKRLSGGIGTFMDVTNRRKIMEQKDEFINVASHELRTPVTSLKAAIQVLERMRDNPKPEIFAKMLAQATKSLNRLTGLIGDLLDSNRISLGKLNIRKTKFNLGNLLTDCSQHVRNAGKHEIIMQGDMNLTVEADEQQIDQVIVNLLNNAVKYATGSRNIYIIAEKLDHEIKISVKDDGPGIQPEQLAHLFERYYRVDYSGFQFSGLGLGLYICSEIIKKHGGRIGVDSEPGNGATFWFTLPTV